MRGIGTSVHFIPLHLHPYYRDTWGYRPGDFPVAEDYFNRCISLPLYPAMSDEDQTRVIDALIEIAAMYGRTGKPVSSGPREEIRFRSATSVVNRHSGHNTPAVYQHRNTPVAEADSNSPLDQPSGHPGFYARVGKRILDVAGAVAGLLAAIPVLAVCATVVWLSSPGPILFRQLRIGRGDRAFELLKFRTMLVAREGPSITAAGDPRITSAGKWLRRWKLDELPQLINVLKGEMSLVGPRPEVPEYVAKYTDRQRRVLECKPGLTSPASLTYIDEEETLASQHDREEYYSRVLLPHKLEIDLGYCRNTSLATDLTILLATARKLLQGKGRNGTDAETPKTAASKAAIGTHATSADRC
jgi:lipopolysaccharide/colanic/teichoic acid biosynthesis glycosyltransferase